ncbi:MAG: hypothetical protein AAGG47_20485 [Pseudomonadota bacterium]
MRPVPAPVSPVSEGPWPAPLGRLVPVLALVVSMLLLTGCSSWFTDEEAEAEAARAAAEAEGTAGPDRPVPVDGVTGIEIGRLTDGIVITAFGVAPNAGFATPQLAPRRNGVPGPDGFIEFDLLGVPPDPSFEMPQGSLRAREIRADRLLRIATLQGIAGIRIHALRNFRELRF